MATAEAELTNVGETAAELAMAGAAMEDRMWW